MNIYQTEKFEKTIKKLDISYGVVKKFIEKLLKDMSRLGLGQKSIKGGNKLIRVVRVNKGDRISLITIKNYNDKINRSSEFDKDGIILLSYNRHDNQENFSKYKDIPLLNIEEEFSLEEVEPQENELNQLEDEKYNPSSIIKSLDINGLPLLTEEQANNLSKNDKPLIISGVAGSGKTDISINKIISLNNYENKFKKVLYVTYTNFLKRNAKLKYEQFELKNKNITVNFKTIEEVLTEIIDNPRVEIVKYNEFCIFLKKNTLFPRHLKKFLKEVDKMKLWSEIRGVTKGYMYLDWKRREERLENIIKYSVYEKFTDSRFHTFKEKESVYKITQIYNKWLLRENFKDENDLAIDFLNRLEENTSLEIYDYLIIDEIQDLSELEIFALFSTIKNKDYKKILITGDRFQTINPTYFDFMRIKNFLKIELKEDPSYYYQHLSENFRNSKTVVELINILHKIRKENIITGKKFEEEKQISKTSEKGQIVFEDEEKKVTEFLERLGKETNDLAIIVHNDSDKAKLIERYRIASEDIYTVYEIKGLEKECIICFNLITEFNSEWNDILKGKFKKNCNGLYIFNIFYVAITRSKKDIIFLDKKIKKNPIYEYILSSLEDKNKEICSDIQEDKTENINHEDLLNKKFEKRSWESYLEDAKMSEKSEDFERALKFYQNASHINDKNREIIKGIKKCEIILEMKSTGYYEKGIDSLVDIKEFDYALKYGKESNNLEYTYLKLIISRKYNKELSKEINPTEVFNLLKKYPNDKEEIIRFLKFMSKEPNTGIYLGELQIKDSLSYLSNQLYTGISVNFYNNGQIKFMEYFKDGRLNGESIIYREDGQVERSSYYNNGKEIEYRLFIYYKNGEILSKIDYKNGKKHGANIFYNKNGQPFHKEYYKDGKKHGADIFFYINGQIRTQNHYKDDKKHGENTSYFESGKIQSRCNYIEDKRQGESIDYYENGQICFRGYYKNDKENGEFIYYHENGKIDFKEVYKEGEIQGERVIYD